MKPVLIIEIASALVALGALATLVIQAVRAKLKSGGDSVGLGRGHVAIGRVLLAASSVHGLAAMAYGSGARPEAYALGWASLALFALSGACQMPPKLPRHRACNVVCHGHCPVYHARCSGQALARRRPGAPCIRLEAVLAAL